jgi:hypothetical protein
MTTPTPTPARRRRYRRDTLTTGRLEVFLAIAVSVALLATLALVALPSPLSRVVAAAVLLIGGVLAFADKEHEDHAGR